MPGSGRVDGFPGWLPGVSAGDGRPGPPVEVLWEGNDPGVGVRWSAGGSWVPVRGLVDGPPGVEGVRSGLAGMFRAAGAALRPPEDWPVAGPGVVPVSGTDWPEGVSGEKRPDGAPPAIDPDRERWPELRKNRAARRPNANAPPAKMVGWRRA